MDNYGTTGFYSRAAVVSQDNTEEGRGRGREPLRSQSWLMAIAQALGDVLNEQTVELSASAAKLNNSVSITGDTAVFQAQAQELNIMSNAASTSIRTMGEANTTLARRQ